MRTSRLLMLLCALVMSACECGNPPAVLEPDAGPAQYCATCKTDFDCGGARCLNLKGVKVCLGTCDTASPVCPTGFTCQVPQSGGGAVCTPPADECCVDSDGDGFGRGMSCAGEDCDDSRPTVHRAGVEECNGLDDDCDGEIDDLGISICGVGACTSAAPLCGPDGGPQVCIPGAPQTETCNGLDDDCNGLIDDAAPILCGFGICQRMVVACVDGGTQACVPGDAGVESCNLRDDDCDGEIDNGTITCGVGACARSVPTCSDGGTTTCDPGMPELETCNGIDDDCNGMVDDGLGEVRCGLGACEHVVFSCVDGGVNNETCVEGTPSTEICNAVDDDCDGTVDDGFGTTSCGAGACARTVQNCMAGVFQSCVPGDGGVEICNGVDDDCNSIPDDGLGTTTCGMGACQRTVQNCAAGMPQVCVGATPTMEVCNGQDDDCDGVQDNGNPGGNASCGTGQPGICAMGTTNCQSGAVACVASNTPISELCNGLDDNCDGANDNATAAAMCPPPTGASTTSCQSAACVISACQAGVFDVNGTFGDGCECADLTRNTCSTPYNLGSIPVGGSFTGPLSNTPMTNSGNSPDWYSVTFPPDGSSGAGRGGGRPTIDFAAGSGAYRFDVVLTQCSSSAPTCGRGGSLVATGLTSWEFVDDNVDAPGTSQWTANQNAWPTTVYVRVYRPSGAAACVNYQLRARRL